MGWLGVGSASSRRTMVAVLFAGFACAAVNVQAQDAPAPAQGTPAPAQGAPAPAQEAAPEDAFKFATDAAVMTYYVKPEQASRFETIWGQIRGGLAASDKPELKAIGDTMKFYKAGGQPTENGVPYFIVVDPVNKAQSYSPSPFFLFETGIFDDATARQYLTDLQGSLNGIVPIGVSYTAAPTAPPAPAAPAAPEAPAPAAPPAQ